MDGVGGSRGRQVGECVCASCAGVGGLKEGAYKVREVGVLEMSLVYKPADWGGVYSLESR